MKTLDLEISPPLVGNEVAITAGAEALTMDPTFPLEMEIGELAGYDRFQLSGYVSSNLGSTKFLIDLLDYERLGLTGHLVPEYLNLGDFSDDRAFFQLFPLGLEPGFRTGYLAEVTSLTYVPEPSSGALCLLGLTILTGVRRSRSLPVVVKLYDAYRPLRSGT